MIPHLSSLSSSSHLSTTPLPTKPSSSLLPPPPKPYPIRLSLRSPNPNRPPRRLRSSPPPPMPPPPPTMMIGVPPDPPWPTPFPAPELFGFQANAPDLFGFHANAPATALPFSLRLLQRRKKLAAAAEAAAAAAAANAVRSLASAIEELHRSVAPSRYSDDDPSRDASDSVVWLFSTVFSSCPCFLVGILDLMQSFLALSVEPEIARAIADSRSDEIARSEIGKYRCWFDVGILDDEDDNDKLRSDEELRPSDYAWRRAAYERLIVADGTNSLILSNYAQLLYQYENDHERANDYFSRAVTAEPADGEAMGRYALFLWRALGDLEKAEDMFVQAIEADPGNNHHRSSYAWFLWNTGGIETCFPLEEDETNN